MNFNFKKSLILFILTPIIVFYFILFIAIYNRLTNYSKSNTELITGNISEKYQAYVHGRVNSDFKLLNSYKIAINEFSNNNIEIIEDRFKEYLKDILLSNNEFKSVWYISNIQTIDKKRSMKVFTYSKHFEEIKYSSYTGQVDNKIQSKLFATIKSSQNNALSIYEEDTEKSVNNVGMSIAIPMQMDNDFIGIIGVDIDIDKLRNMFFDISNELTSNSYLISEENIISLIRETPIEDELLKVLKKESVYTKIETKKGVNFQWSNNSKDYYINVLPLSFYNVSLTPALLTITDISKISSSRSLFTVPFLLLVFISLAVVLLIIFLVNKRYIKRFDETSEVLQAMSLGSADQFELLPKTRVHEFTILNNYINLINSNLNHISVFVEEIGKGNFKYDYKALSEDDYIGNSLIDLRKNLEIAKLEEIKRKESDDRLNWATGGSAKFAEIIREYSDDLEGLSYAIISELVNYIDANQGGLFIINEDSDNQQYIELLASYAYNRKKMFEKRIPLGVGLVGRCIQERETIFMTKVPNDYLNITSGLGKEDPTTLLIVPLIFHEEVFGVVELASFKEIEDYKITLVEQVSEGIASAISMVKINVRTAELLRETKIKSEQAASQEEEIRQNIEEMQTATDELNKKLLNASETLNALKSVAHITEYDINGRVIDISPSFLKILKKEKSEVIGKLQGSFSIDTSNVDSFNKFWRELKKGNRKEFEQMINVEDEILRIYSVYIPIHNEDGDVYKITGYSEIIK